MELATPTSPWQPTSAAEIDALFYIKHQTIQVITPPVPFPTSHS